MSLKSERVFPNLLPVTVKTLRHYEEIGLDGYPTLKWMDYIAITTSASPVYEPCIFTSPILGVQPRKRYLSFCSHGK